MTLDDYEFLESVELIPESNLIKNILKYGECNSPVNSQEVIAHYKGTLASGEKFDSSYDRNEPFKFTIGRGQVIKAWEECFKTMKKGEKALLIAPPEYAYGENGSPPTIPPNATLHFEVELIDFHDKKKEIWEMDDEERTANAIVLKDDGTDLYKEGKYNEAIELYNNSLKHIENVDNNDLKIKIYLNICLCYQKLNNWVESSINCHNVLQIDKDNIKALFRLANNEINCFNFDSAYEIFNRLVTLDPDNTYVDKYINIIKTKQKNFEKKEKLMCKNIFKML